MEGGSKFSNFQIEQELNANFADRSVPNEILNLLKVMDRKIFCQRIFVSINI